MKYIFVVTETDAYANILMCRFVRILSRTGELRKFRRVHQEVHTDDEIYRFCSGKVFEKDIRGMHDYEKISGTIFDTMMNAFENGGN